MLRVADNVSFDREEELRDLHRQGMTNRQIAKIFGVHHDTIGYRLRKLELPYNREPKKSIKMVSDTEAECSKCHQVVDVNEFVLHRPEGKYPYRSSYCNVCRAKQLKVRLHSSIEVYLRDRLSRIKTRCTAKGMPFDLTYEDLIALYRLQQGFCFYTDVELNWHKKTTKRDRLSVDKIIPSLGYVMGNVVLCTHRANTVKADLELEEIKEWLPGWYARLERFLQRAA